MSELVSSVNKTDDNISKENKKKNQQSQRLQDRVYPVVQHICSQLFAVRLCEATVRNSALQAI